MSRITRVAAGPDVPGDPRRRGRRRGARQGRLPPPAEVDAHRLVLRRDRGGLIIQFSGSFNPTAWLPGETFVVFAVIIVGGVGNNIGLLVGSLLVETLLVHLPAFLPAIPGQPGPHRVPRRRRDRRPAHGDALVPAPGRRARAAPPGRELRRPRRAASPTRPVGGRRRRGVRPRSRSRAARRAGGDRLMSELERARLPGQRSSRARPCAARGSPRRSKGCMP